MPKPLIPKCQRAALLLPVLLGLASPTAAQQTGYQESPSSVPNQEPAQAPAPTREPNTKATIDVGGAIIDLIRREREARRQAQAQATATPEPTATAAPTEPLPSPALRPEPARPAQTAEPRPVATNVAVPRPVPGTPRPADIAPRPLPTVVAVQPIEPGVEPAQPGPTTPPLERQPSETTNQPVIQPAEPDRSSSGNMLWVLLVAGLAVMGAIAAKLLLWPKVNLGCEIDTGPGHLRATGQPWIGLPEAEFAVRIEAGASRLGGPIMISNVGGA